MGSSDDPEMIGMSPDKYFAHCPPNAFLEAGPFSGFRSVEIPVNYIHFREISKL
jgi:hypothetical protein